MANSPGAGFDHHSPEYADKTWEVYRDLRVRCPVAHTPAHGGFWVVTDYDHVAEVARDDATFSSAHVIGDPMKLGITIPTSEFVSIPIEMDPPDFLRYRRLLNPFFSPSATQRWLEVIRKWTTVCLDHVIEKGELDIVHDLGSPVPALFTCELLGLPLEHWQKYAEPMHTNIYAAPGTPLHAEASAGLGWIARSLYEILAEKRMRPADDLLSALLDAEIDGELLSDDTIVNIAFLIIGGGFDTTTSMIANMLLFLDHNRDARRLLTEEPDRVPLAIEEFLRYFTPTQALARTVTRSTLLGGQRLEAGERVLVSWAGANHDPDMFENPEEVLLDRFPNRHTAFGLGVHRCLGSNFARAELALMLNEVLHRIPDYAVNQAAAERYQTIGIVNGWVTMPATFIPTSRTGAHPLPGLD